MTDMAVQLIVARVHVRRMAARAHALTHPRVLRDKEATFQDVATAPVPLPVDQ